MSALRFSQLSTAILSQWAQPNGNRIAYFIQGKPGGGKSALSRDVVKKLGIPKDKVVEFNPSLRDPVDVLGTPNNNGEVTRWVPPEEFYSIRQGQGRCALILEEMTDAPVPMQNALCRVILDRHAGQLPLSEELYVIASGNRTEDKSGATRLTTKLGNRMRIHDFVENLDDWVDWALKEGGIDPVLIQFLRFKPGLLADFKADRVTNPTPRAWERVNYIDPNLSSDLLLASVAGDVGDGAAAEYVAFRQIYQGLIAFEDILKDPEKVKIPDSLAVKYALIGSVVHHTKMENLDTVNKFVKRFPKDFEVMYWLDVMRRDPKVKQHKAFLKWATDSQNVVLGS